MENLLGKDELISLNSELSEFHLVQLEERLETDPLAVGGLVELASTNDMAHSITYMSRCECNICWYKNN